MIGKVPDYSEPFLMAQARALLAQRTQKSGLESVLLKTLSS